MAIWAYLGLLLLLSKAVTVKVRAHSSEIRDLCLMKLCSKMLPNLPYFWNKKTQIVFFKFYISSNFGFAT